MSFNKGEETQYEALKKNHNEFRRLCIEEDQLIQDASKQADKFAPVPDLCSECNGSGKSFSKPTDFDNAMCEECQGEGVIDKK